MKKLLVLIVVLAVAFGILAVLDKLPEPVQTKVEEAIDAWIPAKNKLKKKATNYNEKILKSAED